MRALGDVGEPRAFVLGGNASTLAFVSSLRPERNAVLARLVPLAATPPGVVLGDTWQNVTIAYSALLDWVDQTFAPEDEHAFVAPMRDIDLLARIEWHAEPPERLDETTVLNLDDLPEEIADALARPPQPIAQCATCRRLCVRDDFVWKERQLCAWDYHLAAFGKRGPWHNGPYEVRHFETLPGAAYVAEPLLEQAGAEMVLAIAGLEDALARDLINLVLERDPGRAHLAVRTAEGFTLLRERAE